MMAKHPPATTQACKQKWTLYDKIWRHLSSSPGSQIEDISKIKFAMLLTCSYVLKGQPVLLLVINFGPPFAAILILILVVL